MFGFYLSPVSVKRPTSILYLQEDSSLHFDTFLFSSSLKGGKGHSLGKIWNTFGLISLISWSFAFASTAETGNPSLQRDHSVTCGSFQQTIAGQDHSSTSHSVQYTIQGHTPAQPSSHQDDTEDTTLPCQMTKKIPEDNSTAFERFEFWEFFLSCSTLRQKLWVWDSWFTVSVAIGLYNLPSGIQTGAHGITSSEAPAFPWEEEDPSEPTRYPDSSLAQQRLGAFKQWWQMCPSPMTLHHCHAPLSLQPFPDIPELFHLQSSSVRVVT